MIRAMCSSHWKLRVLLLSHNKLPPRLLNPILEALIVDKHMVVLDVSHNQLNDATALAELLPAHPKLVRLQTETCRQGNGLADPV